MLKVRLVIIILGTFLISVACSNENEFDGNIALQPYHSELNSKLERGLIALPTTKKRIFLSWRLLPDDSKEVVFEIFRKELDSDNDIELIAQTNNTSYFDLNVNDSRKYAYSVRPRSNTGTGKVSNDFIVDANSEPRNTFIYDLATDYKQARITVGDLNGDGELEIIIVHSNVEDIDPWEKAWAKSKDTIKLSAFLHTGAPLWSIDLGYGIEAGLAYSPVVVWDIDADGRAEVLLKTNKSKDPLDYDSDRLTVLDGNTGKIKNEAQWPPAKGLGDDYNNNSRNYIAVAHLDGKNPYIIVARGLYKTQMIWAYDNKFNKVWERIIGLDNSNSMGKFLQYDNKFERIWARLTKDRSRGSHSLPIADVNGDGKEEIFWGEHCIGQDGKDIWKITERTPYVGHPDIVFPADIIPSKKGKETFYCREGWGTKEDNIGMLLVDSQGKTIWAHWGYTHIDGGWAARILGESAGMQCYGFDIQKNDFTGGRFERSAPMGFLWTSDGRLLSQPSSSWIGSFPIDWDGDGIKEIYSTNGEVKKYEGQVLARMRTGGKWAADLFGDHREEIMMAPGDGKVYIIFNTEILEDSRRITPLADRQYRNDLSRTAMQANVYPTEGGYIAFTTNK